MNTNINSIAVLGAGWLGKPLAVALQQQNLSVKVSTTTPEKLELLHSLGLQTFLLKVNADGITPTNNISFFDVDLLFVNIPPRRADPEVVSQYPSSIQQLTKYFPYRSHKRIIFIGSTGIYGDAQGKVDETLMPQPDTLSGKALLKTEQLLKDYYKKTLTIIHPGGLFGEDRNPVRYLAGRKNIKGGNAIVNLIHREDLIAIILKIIREDKFGEIYNVVAPSRISKVEFYTQQAQKLNLPLPEFLTTKPSSDFKEICPDKITEDLAYVFKKGDLHQW